MRTKKGDFVELEFVALTEDGRVFDTNIREEASKIGVEDSEKVEPLGICIGQGMLVKGLDKGLEDREAGKDYSLEIKPEEAFGKRDARLVRTVPLMAFAEMPRQGMFINVDGLLARVVSINGGRVLIDMNNPLAGKKINYRFRIKSIIEDKEKKIKIIAESMKAELKKININKDNGSIEVELKDKKQINDFEKRVKELANFDVKVV